jgi:hypothetical protein
VIIAGGVRADLFDNTLWAQLDGQATLTFTPTEFRLDVSAKLEVAVLGVIGTAAGKLVIKHGDGFEMYGALRIQTGDGLKKLEQYGLVLQGGLTLTINTTGTDKNIDLRLAATKQPSTKDTFNLTAGDFDTLYLTHTPKAVGTLTVKQDGQLLVESTDGGKTGDYVLDRYNATVRLSKSITADTKVEVQYDSHDYLDVHQVARAKSFTFVISAVGAFKVGDTEIFRLAASFAISRLAANPTETVTPTSRSTAWAKRASTAAGGALCKASVPRKSSTASSMESGCTSGVSVSIMPRIRAPSWAYLAISGLITTASGQAARALNIGMALRTPESRAI